MLPISFVSVPRHGRSSSLARPSPVMFPCRFKCTSFSVLLLTHSAVPTSPSSNHQAVSPLNNFLLSHKTRILLLHQLTQALTSGSSFLEPLLKLMKQGCWIMNSIVWFMVQKTVTNNSIDRQEILLPPHTMNDMLALLRISYTPVCERSTVWSVAGVASWIGLHSRIWEFTTWNLPIVQFVMNVGRFLQFPTPPICT